jgi:hypothetical protein
MVKRRKRKEGRKEGEGGRGRRKRFTGILYPSSLIILNQHLLPL